MWVGEQRWATVDGFIHRHGGKAVLLGRLTALLRALMPSMAGMSGMRYRTFFVWNATGGADLGARLRAARLRLLLRRSNVIGKTLTWAPLAILALVVAVYVVLHVRRRRRERGEAEAFAQAAAETAEPR